MFDSRWLSIKAARAFRKGECEMRLSRLLLLLSLPLWLPDMALAQAAAPARALPAAARLESLLQVANSGDAAALARALESERDGDVRTLLQVQLAAMRLDRAVLADARLRRLAASSPVPSLRRAALSILTSAAFAQGRYADAARTGAALLQLQRAAGETERAADTAQTLGIAQLLAAEPVLDRIEWRMPSGSAPARIDRVGLIRIDLAVNGQPQEAVFDTGANLSVLSASTARRLGVRMLTGDASVGNSVQSNVAVRLAIADHLEIAGAVLDHVAFLVIDDAALSFQVPGGTYSIPAILGFPEMRALGRIRMEPGRFTVESPYGRTSLHLSNLRAVENSLVVDGEVGGIAVPLHLDSGANPTHLTPAFAAAQPQVVAGLAQEDRRLAGAGGSSVGRAVRWRNVAVELAGRTTRLPDLMIDVSSQGEPSPYFGVVGADLLGRFASYTLDLKAMRLELGEPLAAASPTH
jgi:Aspartyl protease